MLLAATVGAWCQLTCPAVVDPSGTVALSCHEVQDAAPMLVSAHDCGEHVGRAFTIEPASRVAHISVALVPAPFVMDGALAGLARHPITPLDTGPPSVVRAPIVLRL